VTLRIGLVGAGTNTRARHIPGFLALEDVEIVAVANRTRASAQAVARDYDIATVYDDWEVLVAADDIDAVCIGTWPYLHAPVTLRALAAGKHVLTEARMAMDLAEARSMYAASLASDRVAMVVPAPLYLRYEPRLLEMLAAGDFGEPLEVSVSAMYGSYDPGAPLGWRQRRDLSGLNTMSVGILNETVRRYVGHERTVVAHGKTFIEDRVDPFTGAQAKADAPDSLGIVAEHENGAMAVYHFSTVAHGGRAATIELLGTGGGFRLEDDEAWLLDDDGRFAPMAMPPGDGDGWAVEAEFVAAIRDGTPVTRTSFADGVRYMEFTEAVAISNTEGRRVDLPLPA